MLVVAAVLLTDLCSSAEHKLIDNHEHDYNEVVDQASRYAVDDRQLMLYSNRDSDVYAELWHERTRMQQFVDHIRLRSQSSSHSTSSRDDTDKHLITSVENIKHKAIEIEQTFSASLPQQLLQRGMHDAVHGMHIIVRGFYAIAHWALHPVHQQWFNFLTGSIENVLSAYISGAEQWLDAKYNDTFVRMIGSIEAPPKYIGRYIVKIRGKLVDWIELTVNHIYKPLKRLFRSHIVNAYNLFKLNMAMPQSLQCPAYEYDAEKTKHERQMEISKKRRKGKNFLTFLKRLFVEKAYGTVCHLLNSVFKIAMADIKVMIDEKNVKIEHQIRNMFNDSRLLAEDRVGGRLFHIREIKNWVVTKIRAFLVFMTEFCTHAGIGIFNHIKKMIAIGKDIRYDKHKLDVHINNDVDIAKNIDDVTQAQQARHKFSLDPRLVFKRSPTEKPTTAPHKPTHRPKRAKRVAL